jgi:N-acetylglucosamine-6-phosphate deacetylase
MTTLAYFIVAFLFAWQSFSTVMCYDGATVLVDDAFTNPSSFCYDSTAGTIVSESENAKHFDARGKTICPGFIDIQLNGAFGHDFTSDAASVVDVAKQIGVTGVTAFSPTFISSLTEQYDLNEKNIVIGKVSGGAEILNLHLEGPFIDRLGTHSCCAASYFKIGGDFNLTVEHVQERYGKLLDKTAMITLAPQAGSSEVIKELVGRGIVVSLGHSNASSSQADEAIEHGASCFTHLFNAMSPLSHRCPGMPLAALNNQNVFYSIIADGIHVDPSMVAFAYKSNPNMILITDAMAGLGFSVGAELTIGNQPVRIIEHQHRDGRSDKKVVKIVDGKVVLVDDEPVLAGSIISMFESVNNLKAMLDPKTSWADVIKTATTNPARLLNIYHRKNLSLGADADFLVIEGNLARDAINRLVIEKTITNGGGCPLRVSAFGVDSKRYFVIFF